MYFNLMQSGWTANDIDEMDIHFYFSVMNSQGENKKEQVQFIDEIW